MTAVLGRTEIGVREIDSSRVTIPDDPRAKLMYYLNCMCVVLDLNDHPNIARLSNYSAYYLLEDWEVDALVLFCVILRPAKLIEKVLFQNDEMCEDGNNKFFQLSTVQNNFIVSNTMLIGGQRRTVHNIMTYKLVWMRTFWVLPMVFYGARISRLAEEAHRVQPPITGSNTSRYGNSNTDNSGCCVIL